MPATAVRTAKLHRRDIKHTATWRPGALYNLMQRCDGTSLRDLAKAAGLSYRTLYEQQQHNRPKMDVVAQLSAVFGIPIDHLVEVRPVG